MHESLGERIQFVIDTSFGGQSLSGVVTLTEKALQEGVLDEHPDFKKEVEKAIQYINANREVIERFFCLKP
jgi:hypothetical protein